MEENLKKILNKGNLFKNNYVINIKETIKSKTSDMEFRWLGKKKID